MMVLFVGLLSPQSYVFAEETAPPVTPPPSPPQMVQPSEMHVQPPAQGQPLPPPQGEQRGPDGITRPHPSDFPMPVNGQIKDQFAPSRGDQGKSTGDPRGRGPEGQKQGENQMMGREGGMNGQSPEFDQKRQQQQVKETQSRMRGMEQMVRTYKSQIDRLKKQGVAVPVSVSENLAKMETVIAGIKAAKTMEDIEDAGMEELQDLMQEIDEQRSMLERLSRWGQTVKQIDRSLTQVKKQLARDQKLVTKLSKQQIDISPLVAEFEAGVNDLVKVRSEAFELVKTDPEAAFDLIEEGFFEQMEEVMQHDRVIQSMANLGQFTSQFKRRIADADRTVIALKRRKVDTSTLEENVKEIKAKGVELQEIIKGKDIDPQLIVGFMEEFEQLIHEFEDAKEEAVGEANDSMPWEQGGRQSFRPMSSQFSSLFSVKKNG